MITVGSLFSGIGGLELGLERAGMQVKWQVELDDFCNRVLAKHWPDVARFRDVRDVGAHNLEPVDLICGGFPCQDVSLAGKRLGLEGERTTLWAEFARIIREIGPRWVLAENVPGLLSSDDGRFFGNILRDLAALRYDAEWHIVPAAAVGALHRRERLFIVAHAKCSGGAGGALLTGNIIQALHGGETGTPVPSCEGHADVAHAEYTRPPFPRSRDESCGALCGLVNASGEDVAHACCGDGRPGGPGRSEHGGEGVRLDAHEDMAHADRPGCKEQRWSESVEQEQRPTECCSAAMADTTERPDQRSITRTVFGALPASDGGAWGQWAAEPNVGRVVDGVPSRVDRLRALGNAVVPQVAELIGHMIIEAEACL